ncbi:transglutaminase-like domain-containing protein [Chromobacterium subtsugae]|uniref:Transglutaminase-like domain-containing protein n=1 Tax=Chromobacterium subtsugae TaxID=251747 RepID=A0ABS7FDG1_9NEIS|nr:MULTISPECIES: DUF3488 and transglutaminase-like domain-containing protein [Chromobacterium]KUM03661.1 transglutaminase [Chromobacterium subtsugae]KZE86921.1 transglutaminase [Chromobacterium sp. F49]MBW7566818.1 DUF3488 domain-containing transglutaminase family protein [Chromobacterium subtsugae]MBW8288123.1 transglutaminase-like domain-containing protein [Chromobacterium subtsugae]WSE92802.1 DUF3488 and transglutaminase-like domain-containing protein [Chromobacterium subtsugae]
MTPEAAGERRWPALLALAWCALPLAWHLPPWLLALFWLALAGRAWLEAAGRGLPSRWLLLPVLLAAVAVLWLSLRTLVGREGGVALLALLIAFKAFETATLRDWRVLLALGFFLAAMPLLFDQSPLMAGWLVACLLLLTWATAALAGQLPRGSWRSAAQALLLSLPMMLVLFVVMPRLPEPLWSMPGQEGAAASGLGDSMAPGSISQLILNREPAFSAVFAGAAPPQDQLYWRVMLLDDFDGRRWLNVGGERGESLPPALGRRVAYSLTLKPDRGRLPALDLPQQAGGDSHLEAGGLLRQDEKRDELARYALASSLGGRYPAALSAASQAFYRRLPPGNPRSRALAQRLARQAGGERAFAGEALQYLRLGGFRYTLRPPLLGEQAVDQFLFDTRRGFCEHYASAFAFLARAAGIPARVVVGYQGGEYNPVGRFWQVRSSDAHAWVEIWLSDTGEWQRVDPTAAVSPARVEQAAEQALPGLSGGAGVSAILPPGWLRSWRLQWTAVNFAWQQWVVGYDASRQQGLFQRLGLGARVDAGSVARGVSAGMLLATLPLLLWWRRRPAQAPMAEGWRLIRAGLARRQIPTTAAQGPLEVLKAARGLPLDDYRGLKRLVDDYMALRYRRSEPDAAEERRWLRRARRWK